MLIKLIINWSVRNLSRNRQRSIITVLGIASAAGCVFLMQGFANYSYEGLSERFSKSGNGHLQIGIESFFSSATPEKFRINRMQLEGIKNEIQNDQIFKSILDTVSFKRKFSGLIGTSKSSEVFQGQAVDFRSYEPISFSQKFIVPKGLKNLGEFDIVLGKTLANRLDVQIGETVTVLLSTESGRTNAMDFTIAGFVETGATQLDSVFLLAEVNQILKLLNTDNVDVLMIGLKDTVNTFIAASRIKNILLRQDLKGNNNLGVRTWDQLAEYYLSVKALYERILGVIKIILGIIAILAVLNSMLLIAYERRGEVAMLKAIGMHDSKIVALFTFEGAILGIIGGILGILFTLTLAYIISILGGIPMPPPPGSSEGYALKFLLKFNDAIHILFFFIFCTTLASYLAVRKSIKLNIPVGLMSQIIIFLICGLFIFDPSTLVKAQELHPKKLLDRWEQMRGVNDTQLIVETKFENISSVNGANNVVTDAVTYRVAANESFVLAVSISDRPGERMAILSTADGLWMQKEGMRKPMRISPSQRLLGQASNGDIINVKWNRDYKAKELKNDILVLEPNDKSQSAAYNKIELIWNKEHSRPIEAKFYAISGKLLKKATYSFGLDEGTEILKSVLIEDAINSTLRTRITFGKIRKADFSANFFNPDVIIQSMKKIIEKKE